MPISKREFELLKKRLRKEAKYLGARVCNDTYYAKPKTAYIRVRKRARPDEHPFGRGGEYTFDLKRRETIDGIESNIEMEWGIKDISKWRTLLKRLKINPNIRKTKKSTLFKQNNFIIELNHVRLLGYYLEIERVVGRKSEVTSAKKDLIKLFKSLGYSQKQFEPKPYLELLANV